MNRRRVILLSYCGTSAPDINGRLFAVSNYDAGLYRSVYLMRVYVWPLVSVGELDVPMRLSELLTLTVSLRISKFVCQLRLSQRRFVL